MPTLARLYVRTSLLYLALGGLLGGMLLWNKGAPLAPGIWRLLPAHISLVTWGWLWHLTLGVAFWILPRFRGSRGQVWLAWVSYVCLNASIWMAAISSWVRGPWPSAGAGLLQLIAAMAFAVHAWPRVKPAGR